MRKAVFAALDAALAKEDITACFATADGFDPDDLKDLFMDIVRESIASSPHLQALLDGVVDATKAIISSHPHFQGATYADFDDAAAAASGITIKDITLTKETATRSTRRTLNQAVKNVAEKVIDSAVASMGGEPASRKVRVAMWRRGA
jgi:hypothetical protein